MLVIGIIWPNKRFESVSKNVTESESVNINTVISWNSNSFSEWLFGCVVEHWKNL